METCIVRQPILDKNQEIFGYEILYNETTSAKFSLADVAASTIENFLLQLNSDNFTSGKTVFLTFTPNLIMKKVPKIFAANKLVIQIDDTTVVNPLALKMVQNYKSQGYKIAVNSFDFSARNFALLDSIDIIKLDFSKSSPDSLANTINVGRSFKKKMIAYNINTSKLYDLAVELGIELMQGSCVAEKMSATVLSVEHMQSNFFQLMVAITRDEPDVDEIEQIISRDVTLTFSLIKLVNSAYFALRNKVKSVRQALIILGLGQLKQWIYLLSFRSDLGELQSEIIKISFLRANFCSELFDYLKNPPISKSEAYLMGIFSTLEMLMQVPLETVIEELGLSNEIKMALTKRVGICGVLFDLIVAYEQADWVNISKYAGDLGIPMNIITQKYFECVESVNAIWRSFMEPTADEVSDAMSDNHAILNPMLKASID